MYGFHGRLLHIDLSTGQSFVASISRRRVCARFSAASVSARACSTNMRRRESIRSLPPIH